MTKSKKITLAIIVSILAIALITTAILFMINKPKPTQPITPVATTSSETSSEVTSSTPIVVVPDIEKPTSSETVSSKPTEIKVEGNPQSKPTEKPKVDKPKTEVTTQTKPTGNGDVLDPLTNTYPKVGDKTTSPRTGAELTWNGSMWQAETDGGTGGVGTDITLPDGENEYLGAD